MTVAACMLIAGCSKKHSAQTTGPQDEKVKPLSEATSNQVPNAPVAPSLADQNAILQAEIKQLQEDLKSQTIKLQDLNQDKRDLEKENSEMKDKSSQLEAKLNKTQVWLVIVGAAIGTFVAFVAGIIVLAQRKTSLVEPSQQRPTCPRCGWTVAASDSVCGNPDCKTRLK
jgi:hypothetical protein